MVTRGIGGQRRTRPARRLAGTVRPVARARAGAALPAGLAVTRVTFRGFAGMPRGRALRYTPGLAVPVAWWRRAARPSVGPSAR